MSGKTVTPATAFSGSYTTDSNTTSYYRFKLTIPSGLPSTNWAFHVIDATRAFMISL